MEESTSSKILYCDVDSTINNHWVRAQHFFGTPLFSAREIVMRDEPLPGARETLWLFSEKGYKICYLTARDFAEAYSITYDWLIHNDFPIDEIHVVNSSFDKVHFLRNKRVDLFIDDFSGSQKEHGSYKILHQDTIDALTKEGVHFYIFDGDWSKVQEKYL
jgi:hypothetical protein